MRMSDRVVVVGSINVDHTISVSRFPRPGETLLADSLTTAVGGKGANQAVAASMAGGAVQMIGVVGDDDPGREAIRRLESSGVDTRSIRPTADAPTGSAWITVARGDNTIMVVAGANAEWGDGVSVPRADVVLCQLETPLNVVEAAAKSDGCFMLNAAPSRRLPDELLRRCDALLVNEHELADVAEVPTPDADDTKALVAAARGVIRRGARSVVVTLGGRGALLVESEHSFTVEAPPTTDVVDTTGAGDAFCGVYAARIAAGESPADALRWGVTAGSLSVRRPHAQDSYPDLDTLRETVQHTPAARIVE